MNSPATNHQTNIKLTNLHKCTTHLSDHAAGLLTICITAHHLGSLYPQVITLHIHNSSAAKAYSNAHKPTKNSTNPYQLLLQISHQQQTKFPNLSIHISSPEPSESNAQTYHHNKIPNKNSILSHHPDHYDCTNCLQELATEYNLWYITDKQANLPFLGSISKRLETLNHSNYTTHRDFLRGKDGRPPIWTDNSHEFAGQRWKYTYPKTPQLNCRLLYDKHVHGGNITKWKLPPPLFSPLCPKCNLLDSQQHWITECQHHTQRQIRTDLENDLEMYNNQFKNEQTPLKSFASYMASLAFIPGNTHLWLGN